MCIHILYANLKAVAYIGKKWWSFENFKCDFLKIKFSKNFKVWGAISPKEDSEWKLKLYTSSKQYPKMSKFVGVEFF